MRGSEDLGGGLRAVYRLESYLRVDIGAAGRNVGDGFWAREASVGLSGSFGTTVLGRTPTPLWLATIIVQSVRRIDRLLAHACASTSAARCSATRAGTTRSGTPTTPRDPLRVVFSANADESTPGGSNGHNLGLSVAYITGPFAVTVVGETVRNSTQPLPPGFDRQTVLHAAATYDFQFVRVYGQVGRIKTEATDDSRTTSYQLGARGARSATA